MAVLATETTSLLNHSRARRNTDATPLGKGLPYGQLAILCYARMMDLWFFFSIFPVSQFGSRLAGPGANKRTTTVRSTDGRRARSASVQYWLLLRPYRVGLLRDQLHLPPVLLDEDERQVWSKGSSSRLSCWHYGCWYSVRLLYEHLADDLVQSACWSVLRLHRVGCACLPGTAG